ncbi:GNAT family N-acetyltransferase [Pseudovibrio flavus]|uniref:GNAT family N-acetyltransferase n=1 Tax=Pseudovibrio flavus TaxID=2529854 RepID=UPI0027B97AC3|nr:GNAT family N-acetyltransferase [Pseudovibrio flavus]
MEAYWQEAKTMTALDDDDFDDAEFVEDDDIWIRPYTADDLASVVECWEQATRLAHPFFSEDFIASEKHNLEHIYLPNTVTYVAEADGKVVGFIALMGNEIGGLFVSPDHHRQGIARTLVDVAMALNPLGLKVEVFEKNDGGKSFYSAYGFEKSEGKTFEPLNEPLLVMTYAPR